jgi:hypothetical protein
MQIFMDFRHKSYLFGGIEMEENSNMFLACQKFNFATKIW